MSPLAAKLLLSELWSGEEPTRLSPGFPTPPWRMLRKFLRLSQLQWTNMSTYSYSSHKTFRTVSGVWWPPCRCHLLL